MVDGRQPPAVRRVGQRVAGADADLRKDLLRLRLEVEDPDPGLLNVSPRRTPGGTADRGATGGPPERPWFVPPPAMRQTSLHDVHVALGAKMVDFGGWRMPVQYGPILDEVRAVRRAAGLFDLGHMGRFELSGPGAVPFADRLVTCHVGALPVGAIRYGLLCREDGSPIDDLLVYRDREGVALVVNAANAERDLAWLEQHAPADEVRIADRTRELAMVAVQGPRSEAILQRVVPDLDLATIGYYQFGFGTVCGMPG